MKKIKISELPQSTTYSNLVTIGTTADNASVKVSLAPVGEIDSIKASAAAEHESIRKSINDEVDDAVQKQHDTLGISGVVVFDGFVGDVSDDTHEITAPIIRDPQSKVQQSAAWVYFSTAYGGFLIKQDGNYYIGWADDYMWFDSELVPWRDKAFYNLADGKHYKFGEEDAQLHEIALTDVTLKGNATIDGALNVNKGIKCSDTVDGYIIHGDSATFCQGDEVKIDINGNISTEGSLIAKGGIDTRESGIFCGGSLECGDLSAQSATIEGDVLIGALNVDNNINAATLSVERDATIGGALNNSAVSVEFDSEIWSLPQGATAQSGVADPAAFADAKIVYCHELRRFVMFTSDTEYYKQWQGMERYLDGTTAAAKTRKDVVFKCGGRLYAWEDNFALADKSDLRKGYVGDLSCINDAAKEQFIRQWDEAFYKGGREYGKYNRETGYFEGNGLTDISWQQAQVIMKFAGVAQNPTSSVPKYVDPNYYGGLAYYYYDFYGTGYDSCAPRTFPPLVGSGAGGTYSSNFMFSGCYALQAVGSAANGYTGNEGVFKLCRNLRYVLGFNINDTNGTKAQMFSGCERLEVLELSGLLQGTLDLTATKHLTLDSVRYMLNKRNKVGNQYHEDRYHFTIKLHAEVFAKLTDDIIALAEEMNATLASA